MQFSLATADIVLSYLIPPYSKAKAVNITSTGVTLQLTSTAHCTIKYNNEDLIHWRVRSGFLSA